MATPSWAGGRLGYKMGNRPAGKILALVLSMVVLGWFFWGNRGLSVAVERGVLYGVGATFVVAMLVSPPGRKDRC
jgi:hypothetical protein